MSITIAYLFYFYENVDFTCLLCCNQTHFASAVGHELVDPKCQGFMWSAVGLVSIQLSSLVTSECFRHALVISALTWHKCLIGTVARTRHGQTHSQRWTWSKIPPLANLITSWVMRKELLKHWRFTAAWCVRKELGANSKFSFGIGCNPFYVWYSLLFLLCVHWVRAHLTLKNHTLAWKILEKANYLVARRTKWRRSHL